MAKTISDSKMPVEEVSARVIAELVIFKGAGHILIEAG